MNDHIYLPQLQKLVNIFLQNVNMINQVDDVLYSSYRQKQKKKQNLSRRKKMNIALHSISKALAHAESCACWSNVQQQKIWDTKIKVGALPE